MDEYNALLLISILIMANNWQKIHEIAFWLVFTEKLVNLLFMFKYPVEVK